MSASHDHHHTGDDSSSGPLVDRKCLCQGYPRCTLASHEVLLAQIIGCRWCRRVYVYASGREVVEGPGEA